MHHVRDHIVQELIVVADNDNCGISECPEVLGEPCDGGDIKMVGGLVQEQQVCR